MDLTNTLGAAGLVIGLVGLLIGVLHVACAHRPGFGGQGSAMSRTQFRREGVGFLGTGLVVLVAAFVVLNRN